MKTRETHEEHAEQHGDLLFIVLIVILLQILIQLIHLSMSIPGGPREPIDLDGTVIGLVGKAMET